MKTLICMCVFCGCLAAQPQSSAAPPAAQPASRPAKKAPAANVIPKDAVETAPGFFRWKDKNGKLWTYHRTPFGVTRWPVESVDIDKDAADKEKAAGGRLTAVEQGDAVRFEEVTPFGKRTWVRKKTELNEAEQKAWDEHRKNDTASRSAEKE